MKRSIISVLVGVLAFVSLSSAGEYRGQQNREIKSLSEKDVEAIRSGKGWGLAKAAELNGYPGPRHVLDLAEQLELSESQFAAMTALFNQMQADAIAAGKRYLAAEKALELAFRDKYVTDEGLNKLVKEAGLARADMRYVHLRIHLSSVDLLSEQQIQKYSHLRGYAQGGHSHQHHDH